MLPLKLPRNEQRTVIIFFCRQKDTADQIDVEMHPVYGSRCFMKLTLHVFV